MRSWKSERCERTEPYATRSLLRGLQEADEEGCVWHVLGLRKQGTGLLVLIPLCRSGFSSLETGYSKRRPQAKSSGNSTSWALAGNADPWIPHRPTESVKEPPRC